MFWQLTTLYLDYLTELSALLSDPVYYDGIGLPRGKKEPILLIPGFFAGDWTLGVMAGWLSRIGYSPYLSGIDWNIDCPNKTRELLGRRLAYVVRETGGPVIVIGHSLGGLLARFLGVNFPREIRHIVAIGSPINSPLRVHPVLSLTFRTLQALRWTGDQSSPDCGSLQCTCLFGQTVFSSLPQGVELTSIFSKEDEVVDWRTCLDPWGEGHEVSGRHIGLVVNREVYRILAQVLATYGEGKNEPSAAGLAR